MKERFINFKQHKTFRTMDLEIVKNGLLSARGLIWDEYESLCNDDLAEEYNDTLEDIRLALKELGYEDGRD